MSNLYYYPEYEVIRNKDKCTNCKACSFQCAFGVHKYDENKKVMIEDSSKCVNCNRCVAYCPERALKIVKNEMSIKDNNNWSFNIVKEIFKQSETGGVLLSSMGNHDQALTVLRKNRKIVKDHISDTCHDYALIEEAICRIYLSVGNVNDATDHLKKALSIYAKIWSEQPELIEQKYAELQEDFMKAGIRMVPPDQYFLLKN